MGQSQKRVYFVRSQLDFYWLLLAFLTCVAFIALRASRWMKSPLKTHGVRLKKLEVR